MAIGKRRRFEIFKRDGFICRYCGKTPPDATLEVDHIIPKSKGGKDHIINLITSCLDCNRGKSNIKLDKIATRPDIKSLKIELAEQLKEMNEYYKIERNIQKINDEYFYEILDYWYKTVSSYMSDKQQSSIRVFLKTFNATKIMEAIDISNNRMAGWDNVFRYMCGILYNWKRDA